MSSAETVRNQVRSFRLARSWSQEELARRAGVSRTAVSAIEGARLTPSVAAALALAAALDCRVEDLFGFADRGAATPAWAWPGAVEPCRFWHADVAGRTLLYPVEPTALGALGHDGVARYGALALNRQHRPERTLVMASCDPAASLLAAALAHATEFRLLALPRSSGEALRLLREGLVHIAGVHLTAGGHARGNADAVRETLGGGYSLLRMAVWEDGIALGAASGIGGVRSAVRANLRWVGREPGSAARQCHDELMGGRRPPKRTARDHRGIAEAVRCGWAEAGVCLRLTAEEAGLRFLSVRNETYDLCFADRFADDPRMRALIDVVRTPAFRQQLGELPGYDSRNAGDVERVSP